MTGHVLFHTRDASYVDTQSRPYIPLHVGFVLVCVYVCGMRIYVRRDSFIHVMERVLFHTCDASYVQRDTSSHTLQSIKKGPIFHHKELFIQSDEYTYTHTHAHTYTHTHTHAHTHMPARARTHTHTHTQVSCCIRQRLCTRPCDMHVRANKVLKIVLKILKIVRTQHNSNSHVIHAQTICDTL